jgi:hypothetical protein
MFVVESQRMHHLVFDMTDLVFKVIYHSTSEVSERSERT